MFVKYRHRSDQLEWIDLGPSCYTSAEYRDCLCQLARIGRLLGGDRATHWALRQLRRVPASILDVGCGGGFFALQLAQQYALTQIVGIDLSVDAISFAQQHQKAAYPHLKNIQFIHSSSPDISAFGLCDVVMATLVCHHLSDQDLIIFIKQACQTAQQAIILNDLHRHPCATMGFATLAPFFFRNRLIWHDGLLSIRRSFTRSDWMNVLSTAGIDTHFYTISWHWAFRWIVCIDVERMRQHQHRHSHA